RLRGVSLVSQFPGSLASGGETPRHAWSFFRRRWTWPTLATATGTWPRVSHEYHMGRVLSAPGASPSRPAAPAVRTKKAAGSPAAALSPWRPARAGRAPPLRLRPSALELQLHAPVHEVVLGLRPQLSFVLQRPADASLAL